jgi:hypothetical protein
MANSGFLRFIFIRSTWLSHWYGFRRCSFFCFSYQAVYCSLTLILSFDAAHIINSDADLDLDTALNIINLYGDDENQAKKAVIAF